MVAMATSLRKDGMRMLLYGVRVGFGVGVSRGGGEEQGVGEFEGDGGAAEIFVGVRAVGLGGVDDGEAMRDADGLRRGDGGR